MWAGFRWRRLRLSVRGTALAGLVGERLAAGRFGVVANVNIVNTFRNARFAGGVTAVSAADFQRGAFGNRVAVSGAQLQQASLVRGAVPITPTANNLRFSESRGFVTPAPRAEMGSQRFFSRMPAIG